MDGEAGVELPIVVAFTKMVCGTGRPLGVGLLGEGGGRRKKGGDKGWAAPIWAFERHFSC